MQTETQWAGFSSQNPFYFVRRGGHRGNLFCFLFPKFLSTTPDLPKSVAHSANDSSKSSTDMSHTLREGDSTSQTHSYLEKMTLIIFIIFLPLVQIILALQHVFMCVIHPPPSPDPKLFVIRLGFMFAPLSILSWYGL